MAQILGLVTSKIKFSYFILLQAESNIVEFNRSHYVDVVLQDSHAPGKSGKWKNKFPGLGKSWKKA